MREGELRLEPQEGTYEGYGMERPLRVYESSLTDEDGEKLLTFVIAGKGLRLMRWQVDELREHLDEWVGVPT